MYNSRIYEQRTTTCNTVNILLVHVTSKIYQGVPLYTPQKTPPTNLQIYKLYFPKLKLSASTLVFLTAASWRQWWLRR